LKFGIGEANVLFVKGSFFSKPSQRNNSKALFGVKALHKVDWIVVLDALN
jgi:hypothetical protein